jgi:hypothetical protein
MAWIQEIFDFHFAKLIKRKAVGLMQTQIEIYAQSKPQLAVG